MKRVVRSDVSSIRRSARSHRRASILRAAIETLESRKYLAGENPFELGITKTGGTFEGDTVNFDLDWGNAPSLPTAFHIDAGSWSSGFEEGIDFSYNGSVASAVAYNVPDNGQLITISYFDGLDDNWWYWDPALANVDPVASIGNDGPVETGSPATVSLAGASDSSGDVTAGLRYDFDTIQGNLAGDYYSASADSSDEFNFPSAGQYTVWGRIFDKDGGSSTYSTNVTVVLPTPTNLQATVVGATQVHLTWQDNCACEDGYKVEQFINNAWALIATEAANCTGKTISGLTPNSSTSFRIYAFDDTVTSAMSDPADADMPYQIPATNSTESIRVWWDSANQVFAYTIDGAGLQTFVRPAGGIMIDAMGGNDTVIAEMDEIVEFADITIIGGIGNDVIRVEDIGAEYVTIYGGAGNDELEIDGRSNNSLVPVRSLGLFGEDGIDTIRIDADNVNPAAIGGHALVEVEIGGGDGNDDVSIVNTLIGSLSTNGGAGDDTIDFKVLTNSVFIDGNEGADILTLRGSLLPYASVPSATITGNRGHDTITIDVATPSDTIIEVNGDLDRYLDLETVENPDFDFFSPEANDVLRIYPESMEDGSSVVYDNGDESVSENTAFDTVEIIDEETTEATDWAINELGVERVVDSSTVTIRAQMRFDTNTEGDLTTAIRTGPGSDTIDVAGFSGLTIWAGDGTDFFDVIAPQTDHLNLWGEEGNDVFNLGGTARAVDGMRAGVNGGPGFDSLTIDDFNGEGVIDFLDNELKEYFIGSFSFGTNTGTLIQADTDTEHFVLFFQNAKHAPGNLTSTIEIGNTLGWNDTATHLIQTELYPGAVHEHIWIQSTGSNNFNPAILHASAGADDLTLGNIGQGNVRLVHSATTQNPVMRFGAVAIHDQSSLKLHQSGKVVRLSSLYIEEESTPANSGRLDMNDGGLILDYDSTSPFSAIAAYVAAGSVSTPSQRWGLMSSLFDGSKVIGYAEHSEFGIGAKTSFGGHSSLDYTTIFIRLTYLGDATLDGKVNIYDTHQLGVHWMGTGKSWIHGDFNFDGVVNATDLGLLGLHWQATPLWE